MLLLVERVGMMEVIDSDVSAVMELMQLHAIQNCSHPQVCLEYHFSPTLFFLRDTIRIKLLLL